MDQDNAAQPVNDGLFSDLKLTETILLAVIPFVAYMMIVSFQRAKLGTLGLPTEFASISVTDNLAAIFFLSVPLVIALLVLVLAYILYARRNRDFFVRSVFAASIRGAFSMIAGSDIILGDPLKFMSEVSTGSQLEQISKVYYRLLIFFFVLIAVAVLVGGSAIAGVLSVKMQTDYPVVKSDYDYVVVHMTGERLFLAKLDRSSMTVSSEFSILDVDEMEDEVLSIEHLGPLVFSRAVSTGTPQSTPTPLDTPSP